MKQCLMNNIYNLSLLKMIIKEQNNNNKVNIKKVKKKYLTRVKIGFDVLLNRTNAKPEVKVILTFHLTPN